MRDRLRSRTGAGGETLIDPPPKHKSLIMRDRSSSERLASDNFALEIPIGSSRHLAIGWLLLAAGSLVVAGLFTILIVLSRTPGIQEIFPWVDFFHTALVVHVDLTVLVWFLAFAGLLWSLNSSERCVACGWGALLLCLAGTLIMVAAPFLGAGAPLMNNYVPVLRDPIFFTGLGMFFLGFALLVIRGLLFSRPVGKAISGEGALRFGLLTGLITAAIAILALVWSYLGIPRNIVGEYYYELLFWGGGHVLQFTHTQLMLVAWLWLAAVAGFSSKFRPRVALVLFALGAAPTLLTPVIYIAYDVNAPHNIRAFADLMKYAGGIAALPFAVIIAFGMLSADRGPSHFPPERNALLFSILLFGAGGIIGYMISGSNVTVPAHYHGSIVAVTLAFMGLTYLLLPQMGFANPAGRMASLQPVIYGTGQLMHVLGLAWSGGYGVQRKTAGAAQGLDSIQEIAGMGLMGLGGLIAIVGGVLYLVIVFMALWPKHPRRSG